MASEFQTKLSNKINSNQTTRIDLDSFLIWLEINFCLIWRHSTHILADKTVIFPIHIDKLHISGKDIPQFELRHRYEARYHRKRQRTKRLENTGRNKWNFLFQNHTISYYLKPKHDLQLPVIPNSRRIRTKSLTRFFQIQKWKFHRAELICKVHPSRK